MWTPLTVNMPKLHTCSSINIACFANKGKNLLLTKDLETWL